MHLVSYGQDCYLEAYLFPLLGQGLSPFYSIVVFWKIQLLKPRCFCAQCEEKRMGVLSGQVPSYKNTASRLMPGSRNSDVT